MSVFAVIALTFVVASALLFAFLYLVIPQKGGLDDRLDSIAEEVRRREEVSSLHRPLSGWEKFMENLGGKIPLRPEEYGKYRKMMVAAGLRGEMVPVFIGIKLLSAAALPVLYFVFLALPAGHDMNTTMLYAAIIGCMGYIAPSFGLRRMVKNRQLQIFHDLPDVLDVLTICVEAGLSIDASMIRVYEDKQFLQSPLAKEMNITVQETRAGKPRYEALKDMGERTMEEDLKALAAMLIQTERLGTSLADSLRVHSDTLRTKRRQKAEEEAAKTAIKLMFPLVFLLFPSMFIVILVPAFIRIVSTLSDL
ncbi:MAG: type II secretion system F family protein [Thermodesulfobacteriota bacterium]